jgi:hypothetical protein
MTISKVVAAERKSSFHEPVNLLTSSTYPTHSALDTPRTDPLA